MPSSSSSSTNSVVGLSTKSASFYGPTTIVATTQIMPEQSTSSDPIWFKVLDPIESFTGRTDFLTQLHSTLMTTGLTIISQLQVVSGIGGVGKTETVRKYIQRFGHFYKHILWINAESRLSMQDSFQILADSKLKLGLKTENGRPKSVEQLVQEVYENVCQDVTLVVFDNADNYEDHKSHNKRNGIQSFCPESLPPNLEKPFILVTSRQDDWGVRKKCVIILPVFTDDESVCFIMEQLDLEKTTENLAQATLLGQTLGGLPLALQQAVAYIREEMERSNLTGESYQIHNYLDTFEQESQKLRFLNHPPFDSESEATVYTTWNVSLHKIRESKNGPRAISVIESLAFLSSDQIPTKLIFFIQNSSSKGETADGLLLLKKYAMITTIRIDNTDGDTPFPFLTIHRLVQHVIIEMLKECGQISRLLTSMVGSARRIFDDFGLQSVNSETLAIFNNLRIVSNKIGLVTSDPQTVSNYLDLKEELALQFDDIGRLSQAFELLQQVKDGLQSQIVSEEKDPKFLLLLGIKYGMADVLHKQGKYAEALTLLKEVYEKRKNLLGEEHQATLNAKSKIILVTFQLGDSREAVNMIIDIAKKEEWKVNPFSIHDDDFIDSTKLETIDPESMSRLSFMLGAKGRQEEALLVYRKMWQVQKKDPSSRQTLITERNILVTLRLLRRYEEGLQFSDQLTVTRSKALGSQHFETWSAEHHKGIFLAHLNRYEEALKVLEEVAKKRNSVLTQDHSDSLDTQRELAVVLFSMQGTDDSETFARANKILDRVLDKYTQLFKRDHSKTIEVVESLGFLRKREERYEEALELFIECEKWFVEHAGPQHPFTLVCIFWVADVLRCLGRFDEAMERLVDVRDKQKNSNAVGPNHPDTRETEHAIGLILEIQEATNLVE